MYNVSTWLQFEMSNLVTLLCATGPNVTQCPSVSPTALTTSLPSLSLLGRKKTSNRVNGSCPPPRSFRTSTPHMYPFTSSVRYDTSWRERVVQSELAHVRQRLQKPPRSRLTSTVYQRLVGFSSRLPEQY